MKNKEIVTSPKFDKEFAKLPEQIRSTTYDKLEKLTNNPSHPSLRVKKMKGTVNIWEMSITMNYRLTFEIGTTHIFLRHIGTHDILNQP